MQAGCHALYNVALLANSTGMLLLSHSLRELVLQLQCFTTASIEHNTSKRDVSKCGTGLV
jgi:hypothetical protein